MTAAPENCLAARVAIPALYRGYGYGYGCLDEVSGGELSFMWYSGLVRWQFVP